MSIKIEKNKWDDVLERNINDAVDLLCGLIQYPSTRGNEQQISNYLKGKIDSLVDQTELMFIPDSLMDDPDYSFRIENFSYEGTANLRAIIKGLSSGKRIAFNTHLDVVPPSVGQTAAFEPVVKEGKVYGRGACDAKGQAVTLWLVIKALADLRLKPAGDLIFDFVAEEECGGNGTLLVVRKGLEAEAAIVLEPTDLQIAHLVRGAVWFEVKTHGVAGHSGSPGSTVSALKEVIKCMEAIEKVRDELLPISKQHLPEIAEHPNPMPVNFGILNAGTWPAAAPSEAVLKGVFGFLPPFHRRDIQNKLRQAISPYRAEIKFNMLNSDPSYVPKNHPIVELLINCAGSAQIPAMPSYMNASCDSWRYTEQLQIPAVVFGPGSISKAHTIDEYIEIEEIKKAAKILLCFIEKWSGLS